jgi:hypothetical protein
VHGGEILKLLFREREHEMFNMSFTQVFKKCFDSQNIQSFSLSFTKTFNQIYQYEGFDIDLIQTS